MFPQPSPDFLEKSPRLPLALSLLLCLPDSFSRVPCEATLFSNHFWHVVIAYFSSPWYPQQPSPTLHFHGFRLCLCSLTLTSVQWDWPYITPNEFLPCIARQVLVRWQVLLICECPSVVTIFFLISFRPSLMYCQDIQNVTCSISWLSSLLRNVAFLCSCWRSGLCFYINLLLSHAFQFQASASEKGFVPLLHFPQWGQCRLHILC